MQLVHNLEITPCNVQCVCLDGVLSDAELRMRQQMIDEFSDVTTDKLRQSFEFFTSKLQDTATI